MGVAIIYGISATSLLGIACLDQKETIVSQKQIIEEQEQVITKGTDDIANLMLDNQKLVNQVESARQEELRVSTEIGRIEKEIEQLEIEQENVRVSRGAVPSSTQGRKIMVKVTGYCSCSYCCGEWAYKNPGMTASGTVAKYGTIAAPQSLPFGTQMYIEGYGSQIFTVEDTGSAVVYNNGVYVIDMWMPTHEQAYAVGNSIVEATIIN